MTEPLGADPGISQSAFLVNASRARRVDLSLDRYARLWVSGETDRLWEAFSRDVYPFDDVELAVRNRFFLERLRAFLAAAPSGCFLNVAAGFTSYPFLLASPVRCLEIDLEVVIRHKGERLAGWQSDGTLPRRPVVLLAADLRDPGALERLAGTVRAWAGGRPSFALMEGITYYLEPPALERVWSTLAGLQAPGSRLAFDFWTPEVTENPVFRRFQAFFAERFGFETRDYNLMSADSAGTIPGYELLELTGVQEQERTFSSEPVLLAMEEILPEHYAVLERTG